MAALVIGNAAYPGKNVLANPVHDAEDFGAKLKRYGFDVIVASDCSAKEMDKRLKEFRKLLDTNEVGLFFFAGHGMQIEGKNYLISIDTDTSTEVDAKHSSLSLDKVVDAMANSKATTKIIVLDACRDNPWERAWHRSAAMRGLASVYAPKGTIIGFATSPGEVAYDGVGRNGTYTAALLQHIDAEDCSIEMMFKRVRNTVAAASTGKQTTWEHTSLSGEFYFNLSLGQLIDEYDGTALADKLFVLDEAKKSHRIIAGLKTASWYSQNPALEKLDAVSAGKMSKDSLFVIGRNIYQAACGSSTSATQFLTDFMSMTGSYTNESRKALLDGILFEIFIDPNGKLRDRIKGRYFQEAFELQRHAGLKASFEFIAKVVTAAGGNFFSVPGKGHNLAVTVATKKKTGGVFVEAIYIGGVNVLKKSDDRDGFFSLGADDLSEKLSEHLVIPSRLLKITYTPDSSSKADDLKMPRGWSVRKS